MGQTVKCMTEVWIDGQKFVESLGPLPQVLQASSPMDVQELAAWVKLNKGLIEEHLHRSGAVLLRGCGLKSGSDFNAIVEAFDYEDRPYTGGVGQRTHVEGRAFTANEAPLDQYIGFHHEMSQLNDPPSKLFFFCKEAPIKGTGGETPLLWSHSAVESLEKEMPQFLRDLEVKGLKYNTFFGDKDVPGSLVCRNWKTTFKTTEKLEVERLIAKLRHGNARMEWIPGHGGGVMGSGPLPAIVWNASHQRKLFYNHLLLYFPEEMNVVHEDDKALAATIPRATFGDGTHIPSDQKRAVYDLAWDMRAQFQWEQGDVLPIDNTSVLHARNPCTPCRQILVSLVK